MRLFEATWQENYDEFYERYFDTNIGRSVKKRINIPYEWYEPNSKGLYTYILDDNIKLEKRQGRAKDGIGKYGFLDPMYRNIRDNYWGKNSYNKNPRIWYLDIETRVGTNSTGFPEPEQALEPITLMQFYDNIENTIFLLGLRDWVHKDDYKFDYNVKYVNCKNEINLLKAFLLIFQKLDPLIIYAWNGDNFDFPYIYNRCKKLGIDTKKLSNYGDVSLIKTEKLGQVSYNLKSNGHYFLDLMKIYKKFTFEPVPSYSLDTIANIELGERKVEHTEYANFDDFYTGKYIIPKNPTEKQKKSKIYNSAIAGKWDEVRELAHSEFVYYGAKDTLLIKNIDEKRNLTFLMIMIAEKMGVQISDSIGTVKPWAQYISNKSIQNMKVMPPRKEFDAPNIVGGFVREPIKGKHQWVLSADVNSMYPLLSMVGFNMSPETFVPKHKLPNDLRDIVLSFWSRFNVSADEEFDITQEQKEATKKVLKKYNLTMAANGTVFNKRDLGMIPVMVQDIYKSRKNAKKKEYEYKQRKILINKILKEKTKEK